MEEHTCEAKLPHINGNVVRKYAPGVECAVPPPPGPVLCSGIVAIPLLLLLLLLLLGVAGGAKPVLRVSSPLPAVPVPEILVVLVPMVVAMGAGGDVRACVVLLDA